ncbi:hypothetical protein HDU86_003652 [Geranomyces michiganensis]|nr:hypothetical protein HDU86_003652 [Geranomyces michiganensis]
MNPKLANSAATPVKGGSQLRRKSPGKSVFYRIWQLIILAIRAVAPLSYLYMAAIALHFHSDFDTTIAYLLAAPWRISLFAAFTTWMAAETLWLPVYMIAEKRIQKRQTPYHATTDLESRIALVMKCWDCLTLSAGGVSADNSSGKHDADRSLMDARNPNSYIRTVISGWFLGADFDALRRQNMREWVAWAFTDQDVNLIDDELAAQVDELLALLENLMNWTFPPGHDASIKCIRLTLDPVITAHRPVIYYAGCKLVNWISHVFLKKLGFARRTLDPMDIGGAGTLQYLYRAPTEAVPAGALPIVFFHGIGVGFAAYIPLIAHLPRNVPIYLWPLDHVAMQLEEYVPPIPDTLSFITGMLSRDNHSKATFVGHSLGSVAIAWLLNSPLHRKLVGSVALLDPVTFLLCDPTTAYNFLYRAPTSALELTMSYFVSREIHIAHTLGRHFHWSQNVLFYEGLPEALPGLRNFCVLSEIDGIVPSPRARHYLEQKNYENSNLASRIDVVYHEGRNHGEMLFRPYLLIPTIEQIRLACGSAGVAVPGLSGSSTLASYSGTAVPIVSAGRIPGPDGVEPGYNLCEATIPDPSTYTIPPGATLELVQMITRHGDRTPTEHLPNDDGVWDCSAAEFVRLKIPSQSEATPHFVQKVETGAERGARGWANKLPKTNCLLGQLTERGIQQLANLGAALRKVYVDLLGFLPEDINDSTTNAVYVRATDSWRTKQSALALFAGLYPPGHVQKDLVKDLVVYPLEADTLKGRGALAHCPRFRQLRRAMYVQNKDYEHAISQVAPGLQRTLETLLGTRGKGDFDAKVTGWDSLSGFVPPRLCSDKPMPCNARGECVTVEQGLAAVAARQVDYTWMYRDYSAEYSRLYIGPLMGELADMARSRETSSKLQIFSAHDSTVAAILGFLNATSVTWPPLRSNLIFEYWKESNGTSFTRVVYNGAVGGPKAPWQMAGQQQAGGFPDLASLPNRDFYGVLDVARDADPEAIRKAYRRKALRCHPDKAGQDPATVELFQLVQRAYDVLSDPKKRQVYDKYGERGVLMMDQMGSVLPFIDPDFLLAMNTFFTIGSLVAALLIIFPAFVSVRADRKVTWNWGVVSIPLFLFDACLLLGLWMIRSQGDKTADANGQEDIDDDDYDRHETHQQRKDRRRRKSRRSTGDAFLRWLLFLLFQIFVVIRLDGSVDWNWGIVFIPWFLLEAISFIAKIGHVAKNFRRGTPSLAGEAGADPEAQGQPMRPFTGAEKAVFVYDTFITSVLRLAQAALLISKINGSLDDVAWGVIFIPTWLWSAFEILGIFLDRAMVLRAVKRAAPGQTVDLGPLVVFRIVSLCVVSFFLYLGAGLLVRRLDGDSGKPSAAVILIPVFILCGMLFCCFCCCLPCLLCCMQKGLEAELNAEEETGGQSVNLQDRRITYQAIDDPRSRR